MYIYIYISSSLSLSIYIYIYIHINASLAQALDARAALADDLFTAKLLTKILRTKIL